jgi:hypothetical protein
MAKSKVKDPFGFTKMTLDIPDFEAHLEGKLIPGAGIMVKTYPNEEEKPMAKLVGHIGPLNRPVYEDYEGILWVRDIGTDDPYYQVCGEKVTFLGV